MRKKSHWRIAEIGTTLLLGALSFQLTSCSHSSAGAAQPTPPDVEVTVEPRDIPVYREWIRTLDGMVYAAIRAQVTGYLLTQDYSEGSFVKKGELLFQIDPRPLQAAADQARGQPPRRTGSWRRLRPNFSNLKRSWQAPRRTSARRSSMKTAIPRSTVKLAEAQRDSAVVQYQKAI